MQKINTGLPNKLLKQYNILQEKRINENLTKKEHTGLLKLTEKIEEFDIERMKTLIELAKIRNITLNKLSEQLGLIHRINVT